MKDENYNVSSDWVTFSNLVKNVGNLVTRTEEQRVRINRTGRRLKAKVQTNGICSQCCANSLLEGKTKCETCMKESNEYFKQRLEKNKELGVCIACSSPFSDPERRGCAKCAHYFIKRKLTSLKSFQTSVQMRKNVEISCNRCQVKLEHGPQVVCFVLHHALYASPGKIVKTFHETSEFGRALEKNGAYWFGKVEKLELLCKPCHALEHAK